MNLYISLFLIIVIGLGSLSYSKLMNFYINNELDYNEWTPELGSKFETDIASTFYKKIEFVNLNGAICKMLNQPIMNGVVKLDNGYLYSPMEYTSDETLRKYADSTRKFNDYLDDKGISLLYCNTPITSSKYDPQIPSGISDYGNDNCDRFIKMLNESNIDTIDFRETIHNDGLDLYDFMYRTDHHWNTLAGFYAYGKIEEYIVNKTGCEVDERISDINNYSIITYPKWHLGSNGQRTGVYYAGIDDYQLIVPNFNLSIRGNNGSVGNMQDIIINMEPLKNKDYTSRFTYDFVMGASMGHFDNLDCKNDIKVLMITDSFGKAVNPYIAMGFSQMDCVWKLEVSTITREYIDELNPDVVIMLYYPDILKEGSEAFSFGI